MMRKASVVILTLAISSVACQLFQSASRVTPTPTLALPDAPTATFVFQDPLKISIANASVKYYNISGSTVDELREQMNQLGPIDSDSGSRYDARTDWYISWEWPGYAESVCDLSQVHVEYDIEVTLPRWEPSPNSDPVLVDRWNKYMNSLAIHEQGHVDIIVKNYLRVKDAIQNATCDTAEQAAQDVLDQFRQMQVEYDHETGHGNTQGAVFP